ncbi:uncharacterized protein LOC141720693 isoform X1 [Apium graveolens]|uniref:uncharacterized protein LOC141720693 isoform X1 n=1 Tax=Apium graveolens TaxID=4045 RepID=UPI003D7A0AC9
MHIIYGDCENIHMVILFIFRWCCAVEMIIDIVRVVKVSNSLVIYGWPENTTGSDNRNMCGDDVEMGPTADEAMMWQLSLSLSLSLSLPPSLPLQQPASPPSLPPWHNPTTPPSSALISLKMPPSCFRSVIPIILNDLFQICDDVAMGPAADVAMTWQLSPPSLSLSPTTCISSLAAATT